MPRIRCIWLLAVGLILWPLAAPAADLVFTNTGPDPITMTVISPCRNNSMWLVQVKAEASLPYDLPACHPPAPRPEVITVAVFDRRSNAPGWLAMAIAAKAKVRLPAKVIIAPNQCDECDTRYKMQWIPLKQK